MFCLVFFFFKQKPAYEMRISDWSSDVCSSDLGARVTADRIFLIERLVSNLRVRRKNERLGEVERGLGHEVDHAADALRVEVGGLRLGHLDAIEQLPRDDVERQAAGVAVGIAELEAVEEYVVEFRRVAADRYNASHPPSELEDRQ